MRTILGPVRASVTLIVFALAFAAQPARAEDDGAGVPPQGRAAADGSAEAAPTGDADAGGALPGEEAAAPALEQKFIDEGPPPRPGMVMQALDTSQRVLSDTVLALSKRMDRMLGTREAYPEEAYDSVLRLRLIQHFEEGGNTVRADVSGRLSLPGTEDRLGLIFTSEDYVDPLDRERGTERELSASESRRRALAVRYLQPVDLWQTSLSAGLRGGGSGSPVDAVLRGRLWRIFEAGDWRIRPRESLFWYTERGTGASSDLRFEHPLSDDVLFRSESSATYFQRDAQFYYDQVFSVLQPLGHKDGLLWQLGAQGESEPNTQLVNYYLQVRFRHVTYRDWLIFELTPQLLRERDNDYRLERRVFAGFELLFGGPGSY
jgi:hypothetical protein